jgi:hypothetical protein
MNDERQCWKCGARTDVGCKHQPASGDPPPKSEPVVDRRAMNGARSGPWGNKGNSFGPSAARMKAQLRQWKEATKCRE